ncbi:Unknown protein [Striga hermonthica]|uniref:Uncharacterized protein n=1 Tax=Striga hermonthica TaxID=68872 RepID=A0A9N7N5N8_STRHE|nr:Unknown protein [Striga hermonthica]
MSVKILFAVAAIIIILCSKNYEAARLLGEENEQWMRRSESKLLLSSLQRRPVRPPAPNGCTWVPGRGGLPCASTIGNRNFAGVPPPAVGDVYPRKEIKTNIFPLL